MFLKNVAQKQKLFKQTRVQCSLLSILFTRYKHACHYFFVWRSVYTVYTNFFSVYPIKTWILTTLYINFVKKKKKITLKNLHNEKYEKSFSILFILFRVIFFKFLFRIMLLLSVINKLNILVIYNVYFWNTEVFCDLENGCNYGGNCTCKYYEKLIA